MGVGPHDQPTVIDACGSSPHKEVIKRGVAAAILEKAMRNTEASVSTPTIQARIINAVGISIISKGIIKGGVGGAILWRAKMVWGATDSMVPQQINQIINAVGISLSVRKGVIKGGVGGAILEKKAMAIIENAQISIIPRNLTGGINTPTVSLPGVGGIKGGVVGAIQEKAMIIAAGINLKPRNYAGVINAGGHSSKGCLGGINRGECHRVKAAATPTPSTMAVTAKPIKILRILVILLLAQPVFIGILIPTPVCDFRRRSSSCAWIPN